MRSYDLKKHLKRDPLDPMALRDERGALRVRLDATEVELAEARRELALLRSATSPEAPALDAFDHNDKKPRRLRLSRLGGLALALGAVAAVFAMWISSPRHPAFGASTLHDIVVNTVGVGNRSVGAKCELEITPTTSGSFNCRDPSIVFDRARCMLHLIDDTPHATVIEAHLVEDVVL